LHFHFGDNRSRPIVGNFDPPGNRTNTAPILAPVANPATAAAAAPASVSLVAGDAQGDKISYSARALELAYGLDQQLKLSMSFSYYKNRRGLNEKNLVGVNGTYFITPAGDLYQWGGTVASSTLVASLGAKYYADPRLLWKAKARALPVKLSFAGDELIVNPNGYVGSLIIEVTASDGKMSTKKQFIMTFQ
jgi:hypothetical protein